MYFVKLKCLEKLTIFIDLLGYRKYGHNEGDEPRFTQPKLYKIIAQHPNPKKIYADKLINEGIIDEKYVNTLENNYKNWLEDELKDSKKLKKTKITDFMDNEWEEFSRVKQKEMMLPVNTTYPRIKLEKIVETISTLPKGKKFINKIKKVVSSRLDMFNNNKLDWSMAEHLAYGSLLEE